MVRTASSTETAYEEHRGYVTAVLARRCGWLEPDEREEIVQEAYLVVLERVRDGRLDLDEMSAPQLRAFLTQTAINKGLDEGKRVGRSRSVPLEDAELAVPDGGRAPEEVASAGLEGARVREIVADLSERKRAIVKLRFFFDRSPDEIQSFLGISERVYRREFERAMRQIQDGYELVRDGSYCDSRRSGILALMTGIAGPARAAAAREHLASCPSCAAWAARLREAAREVGALTPMPDLVLSRGPFERLLEAFGWFRDGAAEAGAAAKQQASGIAARIDSATPGMLSSARPGTVAAIVAGCVTVGGGTTYCAVNGVPEPLRGAADSVLGNASAAEEEPVSEVISAPAPAPPPPLPSPERTERAAKRASSASASGTGRKRQSRRRRGGANVGGTKPAPAPVESEPVESSASAAPEEFGFEEAAAEPAPTPPPSPAPSSPAPSGGEFGP